MGPGNCGGNGPLSQAYHSGGFPYAMRDLLLMRVIKGHLASSDRPGVVKLGQSRCQNHPHLRGTLRAIDPTCAVASPLSQNRALTPLAGFFELRFGDLACALSIGRVPCAVFEGGLWQPWACQRPTQSTTIYLVDVAQYKTFRA